MSHRISHTRKNSGKSLLAGLGLRRRGAVRGQRDTGSLLILCVTVLVIIALVGIAFLQRVRLDQAATARHERDFMDQVISGILGDISNQLTVDIFENNDGDELYDYPWTKQFANVHAIDIDNNRILVHGAGMPDPGGSPDRVSSQEDDRWLASTAPTYNNTTNRYQWLHLSNLNGIWLDLPAYGSTITDPVEQPIDGAIGDPEESDTNIWLTDKLVTGQPNSLAFVPSNYEQRGVDTDLDGILDARWQWAPVSVREFAGRQYVMAVRIVDLSSMLNVNTATAGTLNGLEPYNDGTKPNVMRGYDPTGVDLSRLTKRVDYDNSTLINYTPPGLFTFGGDWLDNLQEMIDRRSLRGTSTPLLPAPIWPLSSSQRKVIWEEQASIYGNLDRNYLSDSELELRRQGGVNDYSIDSPLEKDMPQLLRQFNDADMQLWGIEGTYEDVVGSAGSFESKISKWFYGTDPSNLNERDTNSIAVKSRTFRGIRHMLTTASGVGAYYTDYGSGNSGGGTYKFDIGKQWTNEIELQDRLLQAFSIDSTNTGDNYLGLNDSDLDDLIDEYMSAIRNYSDTDSVPNEVLGNGYFGLERLPFLREAYFQVLYEDNLDRVDGGGAPVPDGIKDTWEAQDDTQAIAIELGNPFSHDIDDADLDGLIRISIMQSGAEVSAWIYDAAATGSDDLLARDETTTADPNDIMVIISDAVDGPAAKNDNGTGEGDDLESDLNLDAVTKPNLLVVKTPSGALSFDSDGSDITVELQVAVDGPGGTDWVVYDRMDTTVNFNSEEPHTQPVIPTDIAVSQHIQQSYFRDSDLIRYISAETDTGTQSTSLDETQVLVPAGVYSASLPQFTDDIKAPLGGGTWTPPDEYQLALADQSMRSVAELAWVHMLGFTRGEAFSERIANPLFRAPNPDQHFLVIDPSDPDYGILLPPSDKGIPHAAVLMDIMTTVSPKNDGRDNNNVDGDEDITTDTDNTTPDIEQFIPGTINVNTATLPVLTLGSPLAEPIDDIEDLMRTIIAYRDAPITSRASYPNDPLTPFVDPLVREEVNGATLVDRLEQPGIASVGELLFLNYNNSGSAFNMQAYGQDGAPALPDIRLDQYPDPDDVVVSNTASRIDLGDDNEQRLARFQMLSQALSARSDTYVAYVVVRGYRSGRFNDTPVESAQFIAVFNRGSMETDADSVDVKFLRLQ